MHCKDGSKKIGCNHTHNDNQSGRLKMFFSQNPFCLWDPVIATRAFTVLLCSSMFCDSSLPWIEGVYMYVMLKTGQNTNDVFFHPLLFILVLYCFSSSLCTQGTLHHCDMTSHLHRHTIYSHTHTPHTPTHGHKHTPTHSHNHTYICTQKATLFHSSTHTQHLHTPTHTPTHTHRLSTHPHTHTVFFLCHPPPCPPSLQLLGPYRDRHRYRCSLTECP